MDLHIGRDFSKFAQTRYRKDGSESGEEFREERLVPALEQAITANRQLTVVIDVSCSGAFLHEAFAKLSGHGFSRHQVSQHLALTTSEAHMGHYSVLALRYIREGYEPSPNPAAADTLMS
jgi:hypothetical protein